MEFNANVFPICLPVKNPDQTYVDQVATATGFGALMDGTFPDLLQEVNVKVISFENCQKGLLSTYGTTFGIKK